MCHKVLSADSIRCGFDVLVAKRKSLFDDKAVEIEELTYIIKQVSWIVNIPWNVFLQTLLYVIYKWSNSL